MCSLRHSTLTEHIVQKYNIPLSCPDCGSNSVSEMLFHMFTLSVKPVGRVYRWHLSDVIYFIFLHFKHNLVFSKHYLKKKTLFPICLCACIYIGGLGILNNFDLPNFPPPPPPPALSFQKIPLDNHHSPPIQKTCCPVNLCFTEEYQLQVWKDCRFCFSYWLLENYFSEMRGFSDMFSS